MTAGMRKIMKVMLFLSYVSLVVIGAVCHAADARSVSLKSEFLQKYEPAMVRLQDLYGHVEIDATMEHSVGRGEQPETYHLRYRSNGSLKRLDIVEQRDGVQNERSGVIGSQAAFEVTKQGPEEYFVSGIESNRRQALQEMQRKCPVFSAPYSLFDGTVQDFIRFDDLAVTDFKTHHDGDEELATLSYERHLVADGHKIDNYGSFTFLPAKCWALRRYSIGSKDPNVHRMRAEIGYEGAVVDIPLLKRAEYWDESGPNHDRTSVRVITIKNLERHSSPAKDFTLREFGLPDVLSGETKRNYVPYVVVAAGIIVVFVGVLVRRRAAHR